MTDEAPNNKLRSLVSRYKVCWDSFPEWSQKDGRRQQTGEVVELYGTHDVHDVAPRAGCKHCIPVIQALLAIADHVADPGREELATIRAHSGIQYAVERGSRPDIVVALTFAPSPGAEAVSPAVLEGIKARLHELGASQRTWRPSAGA
jgi:hypothetical protein